MLRRPGSFSAYIKKLMEPKKGRPKPLRPADVVRLTGGKVNATIPKDIEPEQITLEQAVELIAVRGAKGPAKKAPKASSPGKKSARKGGKSNKEAVEETAG